MADTGRTVEEIQDLWTDFDKTPEFQEMKNESAGQFFEDFSIAIVNGWKLVDDDMNPDGPARLAHDDHAFTFPASQPQGALELIGIVTPDDKANALMAARAGMPAPARIAADVSQDDPWDIPERDIWDIKPDPDAAMNRAIERMGHPGEDDIFDPQP